MVNTRWMATKDLDRVTDIELRSNDYYLSKDELVLLLRKRNIVAMVATEGSEVVGFMVYELLNRRIQLISLGVHPGHRRKGVGKQLIQRLCDKLSPRKRTKIFAEVRESNLHLLLFLKKQDFVAVEVLKDYFEDTGEDSFVMQYSHRRG
jgi:[ribosomal protein S18]-alanine N-acetyltransferase